MKTPLVVRIPEEQKAMLQIMANYRNLSVSQLTRLAIKDYIANLTVEGNLFAKLAKIGSSKKIKDAPSDLSENYKEYLYGAK